MLKAFCNLSLWLIGICGSREDPTSISLTLKPKVRQR